MVLTEVPKLTEAQKQTKLRSGIQPLQIIMNTNYLAKPQFPLTSDLFEFPYLIDRPNNLEKYPLISTNVKYDASRIRFLTHVERFQIVFSVSRLLQFISELPIEDDSQKSEVLKHNAKFMLDMLFPISYPVIKEMKVASIHKFSMSVFDALSSEAAYQKFNTYLKLDGKTCTVDEMRFMDTFGANPIYVKLYDFAKDFIVRRDAAIPVLNADIRTRLQEFKTALSTKTDDVVKSIVAELNSLSGINTNDTLELEKINDELEADNKELTGVKSEITKYENLFEAKAELLNFRQTGTPFKLVSKSAVKEISQYLQNFNVFSGFDLNEAYRNRNLSEIEKQKEVVNALTFSGSPRTPESTLNKRDFDSTKEALTRGFDSLIKYLKIVNLLKINVDDAEKMDNKKFEKTERELEAKIDDLNDKIKKINSKKKISTSFIGAAATDLSFTEKNVLNALSDKTSDYKSKIKNLNSKLKQLVDEYELITANLNTTQNFIVSKLAALDPATIEQIKDEIKTVYEANQQYFSQRTPLVEAFMKLRKICGFAYLITTIHQYQENMNIEREYNVNYNIDADLKKGEYLFHRTTTESLRAYYYPIRQSMEPAIKAIISVKDTEPIDMDAIVDRFENDPNTPAAIDLVDLGGKPRYECQCLTYLVGGIITKENSSKIDCSYQNRIIGAGSLKENFNLVVPEFTDLTQHIAEMEKIHNIKYEKKKLEDYSLGSMATMGSAAMPAMSAAMPAAMPPAPPAMPAMPVPAPKKTAFTVSDTDLERIISANMPSGSSASYLKDFVKTKGYETVKEFLETAINYSEKSRPNPSDYADAVTKTTYKDLYEEKKIDANSTIDTMIRKKTNEQKKPSLTSTEIGAIAREIGMLKALQTVISGVDKLFDKMWSVRGGKKTRKHRRKRGKKTRRHKSK